jgi:hypothetical protein
MMMQCPFFLLLFNKFDCCVNHSSIIIIVFIDIIIKIVPSVILLFILIKIFFHHHIMKNNRRLDNYCYIFDVSLLYCLHKELNVYRCSVHSGHMGQKNSKAYDCQMMHGRAGLMHAIK